MDHQKRNVHHSGPLGMLMNSGQIQEVNEEIKSKQKTNTDNTSSSSNDYLVKGSGITFSQDELLFIDPKHCEPWEFANRHNDEMGDITGLMESISSNNQLQPALVRSHPTPHDGIKYEIIFGRRRHQACLNLEKPFLVILKKDMTFQEALSCQHSENKCRDDVSPYSDSIIYKKVLDSGLFKNQKELACNLNISKQTLSDILSFTKIPKDLLKLIPNPHALSISMAKKIVSLVDSNEEYLNVLINNASLIGNKITSVNALEKLCSTQYKDPTRSIDDNVNLKAKVFSSDMGTKLFSFKTNSKGSPTIVVNKQILDYVNTDDICDHLIQFFCNKIKSLENE